MNNSAKIDPAKTCIVFAGPTIPARRIEALLGPGLEIQLRPPAAQGDLYSAARQGPRAIALIDGYFDGVPSVWHKEILWALEQGVHVFGASSMGALRAAELQDFGMVGAGEIFEAFRTGALEDDDEVAVQHGPAEAGYIALSEAMVNLRATLAAAEAAGVIEPGQRRDLEAAAKTLFYPERNWDALFALAESRALLPPERLAALRAWLPEGRIDLKQRDAETLLGRLKDFLAQAPEAHEAGFTFEHTALWDDAVAESWSSDGGQGAAAPLRYERVLDELRLRGEAFAALRRRALGRFSALMEVERQGLEVPIEDLRQRLNDFRLSRGLTSRARLDQWLREQDLEAEELEALIGEEALLAALESRAAAELPESLLATLRLEGGYAELAERARDKAAWLAEQGLSDAGPGETGQSGRALLEWYFLHRLEAAPPDDLRAVLVDWGLRDDQELYRLLAREYLYWRGRERTL